MAYIVDLPRGILLSVNSIMLPKTKIFDLFDKQPESNDIFNKIAIFCNNNINQIRK